jgi:hypothetical protein
VFPIFCTSIADGSVTIVSSLVGVSIIVLTIWFILCVTFAPLPLSSSIPPICLCAAATYCSKFGSILLSSSAVFEHYMHVETLCFLSWHRVCMHKIKWRRVGMFRAGTRGVHWIARSGTRSHRPCFYFSAFVTY